MKTKPGKRGLSVQESSVRVLGRAGAALPLLLPLGHAGSEGADLLLAVPPVPPLGHALLQLPVLLQAAAPRDPGVQRVLALILLAPLRRRGAPGVPGLRHVALREVQAAVSFGGTSPQPWVPSALLACRGSPSPGISSPLHDSLRPPPRTSSARFL